MLSQLSLFQQCSIQSQDVMQTWLHWRHQDALLVQNHFVALFHPKRNECLRFDLEICNLMCTYTVVTHQCHISLLAQARPMMLCIYTSYNRGELAMKGEKQMLVNLYNTKVSKTILLACATTQFCISATCSSQLQVGRFIVPAQFNATIYNQPLHHEKCC